MTNDNYKSVKKHRDNFKRFGGKHIYVALDAPSVTALSKLEGVYGSKRKAVNMALQLTAKGKANE